MIIGELARNGETLINICQNIKYNKELINYILEYKVDINYSKNGNCALFHAAKNMNVNLEILEYFKEKGATDFSAGIFFFF